MVDSKFTWLVTVILLSGIVLVVVWSLINSNDLQSARKLVSSRSSSSGNLVVGESVRVLPEDWPLDWLMLPRGSDIIEPGVVVNRLEMFYDSEYLLRKWTISFDLDGEFDIRSYYSDLLREHAFLVLKEDDPMIFEGSTDEDSWIHIKAWKYLSSDLDYLVSLYDVDTKTLEEAEPGVYEWDSWRGFHIRIVKLTNQFAADIDSEKVTVIMSESTIRIEPPAKQ